MDKRELINKIKKASINNKCTHIWKEVYTINGTGVMCVLDCGVLLCDGIHDRTRSELIAKEANSFTKNRKNT